MNILESKTWNFDPIDKMIFEEGLRIKSVHFDSDIDLMLIVLNNKKVLEQRISISERLKSATLEQLMNYQISRTGLHWPALDEDLSLRGFIKDEMLHAVKGR
jgi:Protein of unknown function (DUF2442)